MLVLISAAIQQRNLTLQLMDNSRRGFSLNANIHIINIFLIKVSSTFQSESARICTNHKAITIQPTSIPENTHQ